MMNWEGRRIPKKCLAHLEGKFCTYHGLILVQYQDQLFFGPILVRMALLVRLIAYQRRFLELVSSIISLLGQAIQ